MVQEGFTVDFNRNSCEIKKLNELVAIALPEEHLYKLKISEYAYSVWDSDCNACIHTWHRRFGHKDPKSVKEMLNLIHTDICGPMENVTPSGRKYFMTLIDDYSRFTKVYFLKQKSEAVDKIKEYVREMENYFDDIVMASKNEDDINVISVKLNEKFQLNSLGDIRYYLGIKIERNSQGLFTLNQEPYIDKILNVYGVKDAKSSKLPISVGYYKNQDENKYLDSNEVYRQVIGSLLYLAVNTRPDIAVSTSILSRKISKPTHQDWTEVKRILRYLNGTKTLKLYLGNQIVNESVLLGYVDADWGGDKNDRKSNSGYVFKYKGSSISWRSKKQECVSLSSTEAEFIALCEACQEAIWIKKLLINDFNLFLDQIIIYEDNQGCLKLVQNETLTNRTKHIETKFHFVKELKENNKINFEYCCSENMIADIFTKPLDIQKLQKFREELGLFY